MAAVTVTTRIAEVESELAAGRALIAEQVARVRGLEAELESLRSSVAGGGDLVSQGRTDAIVAVLREAGRSLSVRGIVQLLESGGRTEDTSKLVGATLSYLVRDGRVQRAGRGIYLAV